MTNETKKLYTIKDHLTECEYQEQGFRKIHNNSLIYMNTEQRQNISNGLYGIKQYYDEIEDNTLLSNYEFAALVGYAGLLVEKNKNSNEPTIGLTIHDFSNIALLIDTFKKLKIDEDDVIPFIISKNFDELYFSVDKGRTALKQIGDMINHDRIWTANREGHMADLENFLEFKAKEYADKRTMAINKMKNYCDTFKDFGISERYEKDMLNLLIKAKYDIDLIFSYIPSANIVVKDYTAIRGTNLNAMSTALLEHFLFKDRNLTGIPNVLGTYKLPDGKEILIPFTKNEFRNSLHTELVKENYIGQARR